jgi:hypothetical protein
MGITNRKSILEIMSNEQWGVGNAKDSKAFDTTTCGTGNNAKTIELIHGEHPHSRRDNTTYARTKDGRIYGFDGHRAPIKIEIEEYNYLKESELSGDEIRKGCSVKVFAGGVQIFDEFHRDYHRGYLMAKAYIDAISEMGHRFPKEPEKLIGKVIGYREQLCKIDRVIVEQGCLILSTVDGKPFKRHFLYSEDDWEEETSIKVEITSPHICWHVADDFLKAAGIENK